MRKQLCSGQKWFLRPYFPLIRGMFFKSGLRFSFRALEVPEPRVRNKSFSLTKSTFSSLSVGALPVLEASEQKVGWMDGLDGYLFYESSKRD